MASESFIIEGDVNVQITITELENGNLKFDIKVLDDTGSIGDLNAIYFDLSDDSLASTLSVVSETSTDVTGTAFKADGVTKVDNFTNMNGEVVQDLGKFDGGIQFGTQGISKDDIRETSFELSSSAGDLSLEDFSLQDFGIRLTSVGEEGGSREDSLKLGGTAPLMETDPELETLICDDTMTVTENEVAQSFGGFPTDQLDTFEFSLLANNADANAIASVAGGELGQMVAGSNGGFILINADGTFDFDAGLDFKHLNDGQSQMTEFAYTMDNGQDATLCITVTGITDGPGGPDGVF